MNQNTENFTGSAFINPMTENTEPEFVTVVAILAPSGVDGDALEVTFPSNEHVVFSTEEGNLPEHAFEPDVLLQNIVMKNWETDPDVPHMIRWFMLQQKEFIENIEKTLWLLEIDAESNPEMISISLRFGDRDEVYSRSETEPEEELELI